MDPLGTTMRRQTLTDRFPRQLRVGFFRRCVGVGAGRYDCVVSACNFPKLTGRCYPSRPPQNSGGILIRASLSSPGKKMIPSTITRQVITDERFRVTGPATEDKTLCLSYQSVTRPPDRACEPMWKPVSAPVRCVGRSPFLDDETVVH